MESPKTPGKRLKRESSPPVTRRQHDSLSPQLTPRQKDAFARVATTTMSATPLSPSPQRRTRAPRSASCSSEKPPSFRDFAERLASACPQEQDPSSGAGPRPLSNVEDDRRVPIAEEGSSSSRSLLRSQRYGSRRGPRCQRVYGAQRSHLAAPLATTPVADSELHDAPGGTMRSRQDLRQAQGNRRFVEEVEYVLEPYLDRRRCLHARRESLLALVNRLGDPRFRLSLRANGLDERVFSMLAVGEQDRTLRSLLLAMFVTARTDAPGCVPDGLASMAAEELCSHYKEHESCESNACCHCRLDGDQCCKVFCGEQVHHQHSVKGRVEHELSKSRATDSKASPSEGHGGLIFNTHQALDPAGQATLGIHVEDAVRKLVRQTEHCELEHVTMGDVAMAALFLCAGSRDLNAGRHAFGVLAGRLPGFSSLARVLMATATLHRVALCISEPLEALDSVAQAYRQLLESHSMQVCARLLALLVDLTNGSEAVCEALANVLPLNASTRSFLRLVAADGDDDEHIRDHALALLVLLVNMTSVSEACRRLVFAECYPHLSTLYRHLQEHETERTFGMRVVMHRYLCLTMATLARYSDTTAQQERRAAISRDICSMSEMARHLMSFSEFHHELAQHEWFPRGDVCDSSLVCRISDDIAAVSRDLTA